MSSTDTSVIDVPVDPLRPESRYPESTIDYCARLPKRRWAHQAKGRLLELPRTGMIVVPYEQTKGGWYVVVVSPDRNGTYQPDGYSLAIGDAEIETAIERSVGAETNLEARKVEPDENSVIGRAVTRMREQRASTTHELLPSDTAEPAPTP